MGMQVFVEADGVKKEVHELGEEQFEQVFQMVTLERRRRFDIQMLDATAKFYRGAKVFMQEEKCLGKAARLFKVEGKVMGVNEKSVSVDFGAVGGKWTISPTYLVLAN